MAHAMNEGNSPLQPQQIPPSALVYDLVYNPLETPLIRAAARAGAATLGGIHMLVYQGAASFELWLGSEAPVEVMMLAAVNEMACNNYQGDWLDAVGYFAGMIVGLYDPKNKLVIAGC